ncbi:MAG: hypothetical protein ACOX5R_05605 [bacterium]
MYLTLSDLYHEYRIRSEEWQQYCLKRDRLDERIRRKLVPRVEALGYDDSDHR